MTSKVERLMTIVDLEALPDDDNRELIEGELFVSPAPEIPHQVVLNRPSVQTDFVFERPLHRQSCAGTWGCSQPVGLTSQVISDFSVTVESLFNDVR